LWQFAGHTAANNIEVCFNCHIWDEKWYLRLLCRYLKYWSQLS
jgi:hypothetical protein